MAVIPGDIAQSFIRRESTVGPVTAARHRRTATIYAGMCIVGLLPMILGISPALQAAGLGLWIPGAGFLAVGGWAILLFPVTLALFALAVFGWFGAGMVIAPIIVWLGSALLAGRMVGDQTWFLAPYLVVATVAGIAVYTYQRQRALKIAELTKFEARKRSIGTAITEAIEAAAPMSNAAERELTPDDLAASRYALDRALQPVGQLNGYDKVEQFQTSALRYQINHLGYGLGMLQCMYTPSFHGYLSLAQRNLIELYLDRRIWGYWVWESAWGHLNFTNPDPAEKDNIMLTGWFGIQLCLYMSNTGDRRYAEPGSVTFRMNERRAFHHDAHTIAQSVMKNFLDSEFCLYPCEPNWVYPICNHYGMTSLKIYDRVFGTKYVPSVLDRWLKSLDTEFTDYSGSVIGLRSSLTGIRFPFPAGDAGFAGFENCFAPDRAQRMWATARQDLKHIIKPDATGAKRLSLPGRGFDFGNYKSGYAGAYAMLMDTAREFGDYEIADAALRALDQDCGRAEDGGVLRYSKGSNLSNAMAMRARIHRRDDFRRTIAEGPPEASLRGPILADAKYPDVLVARAFSDGDGLDLVLYPGAKPGRHDIRVERLRPGARYAMRNGSEHAFVADNNGAASLKVDLNGRTPLRIVLAA
jgi:Linalool dehydratase/isomerase